MEMSVSNRLPATPGVPTGRADVGGAIKWAFSKFGQNAGVLIAVAAIILVLNFLGYFVSNLFAPELVAKDCTGLVGQAALDCNSTSLSSDGSFLGLTLTATLIRLLFVLVGIIVQLGLASIALKITRGEKVAFADLWKVPNMGSAIMVTILLILASFVGLLLCVIPALLVWWAWQFSRFAAIDLGEGIGGAFRESWRLVSANKSTSILTLLILFVAGIVTVATLGIGALVTEPFAALFMAHMYRQFRHEDIA